MNSDKFLRIYREFGGVSATLSFVEGSMNHIPAEQLEQYSRNKIAPENLALIEEHLLICGDCRWTLDVLEEEARVIRHALVYYMKPQKD